MALILRRLFEAYNIAVNDWADERTKDWFLAAKPLQIFPLVGLYLLFVLKWGPKFMQNREPFKLDKLLIVYNAAQVVACIYLFVNCIVHAWGWKYKWICEPVDRSHSEHALKVASLSYMYFILKVVDLLDTVFFVLRKKGNQVSFLHIYHHTGMVLLVWGAVTYLPGGHGTLIGVINTFVHIVMYSYYLYTVINPAAKQSIWWKKHITQLQILQFFWCVVHMAIIVFKTDCEYPRWTAGLFLPQNLFILVLFIDFYIKTYIKKPKANIKEQNGCNNGTKSSLNGTKVHNNGAVKLQKCDLNNKNGILNGVTQEKNTNKENSNDPKVNEDKNNSVNRKIDRNGCTDEKLEENGSVVCKIHQSEKNKSIIKGKGHISDKYDKIE